MILLSTVAGEIATWVGIGLGILASIITVTWWASSLWYNVKNNGKCLASLSKIFNTHSEACDNHRSALQNTSTDHEARIHSLESVE